MTSSSHAAEMALSGSRASHRVRRINLLFSTTSVRAAVAQNGRSLRSALPEAPICRVMAAAGRAWTAHSHVAPLGRRGGKMTAFWSSGGLSSSPSCARVHTNLISDSPGASALSRVGPCTEPLHRRLVDPFPTRHILQGFSSLDTNCLLASFDASVVAALHNLVAQVCVYCFSDISYRSCELISLSRST